jgi:Tfp pilus assembly protein FimT
MMMMVMVLLLIQLVLQLPSLLQRIRSRDIRTNSLKLVEGMIQST